MDVQLSDVQYVFDAKQLAILSPTHYTQHAYTHTHTHSTTDRSCQASIEPRIICINPLSWKHTDIHIYPLSETQSEHVSALAYTTEVLSSPTQHATESWPAAIATVQINMFGIFCKASNGSRNLHFKSQLQLQWSPTVCVHCFISLCTSHLQCLNQNEFCFNHNIQPVA